MQYLTVAETAERLGVKRETVYAYASRGLLTSVRSAERRGSRFAQDEVERLAARGRESDPPSGAVERIRTAISLLSDDGLCYRGVRAASLSSLEDAAGLLWETDLPDMLPDAGREAVARAALGALPPGTRLTDRIRLAVAAQAAVDPLRADVSEPAVVRTAANLLGTTVAALAPTALAPTAVAPPAAPTTEAPASAAPAPAAPVPDLPHPSSARRTRRSGCDTPTRGAGPPAGASTSDAPVPDVSHPASARRTGRSGCDTPTRGAAPGERAGVDRSAGPGTPAPSADVGPNEDRSTADAGPSTPWPDDGSGGSIDGIAGLLWPTLLRDPERAGDPPPAFGAALVLLADHGLAASTVAARVAASTRADVYAVVSAGLGALDGRDHGLVSGLAHRFLGDARTDPVGVLAERLRAAERVPGFGHAVYSGPDPRAATLFALLRDDPAAADVLSTVDTLVDGMARGGAPAPNVDLALAALMHAYDLRSDAGEAIFAVARTVGWVAHALEEYREPGLRFRPVGVYIGPRPG